MRSSAFHVGSPAPMTSRTAWLPTQRSPLARSKQRKCVQQSSQLIGAQRKKICGSVMLGRGGRRARRRAARPTNDPSCRSTRSSAISWPSATMRPDHVPHCVMRVESMTVFVPAVSVWRGSSSATVRAVNVTSASMPRSAASAAHARDAQRLDDLDRQRTDARLAAIGGDAARREHRTLHAVVHDRERAVDDAAVRVHGHARGEVVVLGVAVEPEPVVVVRVAGRRMRERQRRLVDRIVVERCQHDRDATSTTRG